MSRSKKVVIDKNFTYHAIIKEAILALENQRGTSAQIFDYMSNTYPDLFTDENSSTWKNNVRQLLSKSEDFIKQNKESTSKLHYWIYIPKDKYERNMNYYGQHPRIEYNPPNNYFNPMYSYNGMQMYRHFEPNLNESFEVEGNLPYFESNIHLYSPSNFTMTRIKDKQCEETDNENKNNCNK